MKLGSGGLKVVSGVGTLVVAGGAGVLVGLDPKPPDAPLRPPVSTPATATNVLAPLPPSCGTVNIAGTRPGNGTPVQLTAQQQSELQQLQSTPKAKQNALLMSFPAADRLQISAYIAQRRRGAGAANATGACNSSAGQAGSTTPLVPSTGTDGPSTPIIITSVS